MKRVRLLPLPVVVCVCLAACQRTPLRPSYGAAATDGGASLDGAVSVGPPPAVAPVALPAGCEGGPTPPTRLECTGLYADVASKALAASVFEYAPAVQLWSDGAGKRRFIWLPPGAVIDAKAPDDWLFPVGTKLWKEFSVAGRRIETRLWQKVRDGFWVAVAYAWNAEESSAAQSPGGDVAVAGGTYHIPTRDECEKCHRGRTDNILGFEQVSLGLPGATGLTLAELVARKLIAPAPARTSYTIGDDGTGAAAAALGWMHANCGTTCHNDHPAASAYSTKLRLRLRPDELDGRSVAGLDPLLTTVGVAVNATSWRGRPRIAPGNPEASVLHELISHRGEGRQMPPIASRVVDEASVRAIADWIRRMPGGGESGADAGAAAVDAAADSDANPPDSNPL